MDLQDQVTSDPLPMEEEDNTKENEGATMGGQFAQSFAALDKVSKLLECTKCAKVPVGNDKENLKIYTLGNCFHKYCSSCVESFSGRAQSCGACKVVSKPGKAVEDTFSSSVVAGLLKLKEEMIKSTQMNKDKKIIATSSTATSTAVNPPLTEENMIVESVVVVPIPAKRSARSTRAAARGAGTTEDMNLNVAITSTIESPVVMNKNKPIPAKRRKSSSNRCLTPDLLDPQENEGMEDMDDDQPIASTPLPATRGRAKFTPSTIESGESKSTSSPTPPSPERPKSRSSRRGTRSNGGGSIGGGSLAESKTITSSTSTTTTPMPTPDRTRSRRSTNGGSIGSSDSPVAAAAGGGNASFSSNSGKIDKKNSKGETPLHIAVKLGQLEKAQQLVEAGSDVNIQDYAGWTALHEAINGKGTTSCKLDLVKLLVEQGSCNPNIPGMENESALHEAARAGLKDIIVYLLEHGASPNIRNSSGKLPRDVADAPEIAQIFDDSSTITSSSLDASLIDDPVVLEIQLSHALLYFSCNVSPDDLLKVEQILKLKVSKELGSDVTHMIFMTDDKKMVSFSYEYLQGIANGAWILSSEWIDKSIEAKKVLSPSGFEVQGCDDEMADTLANAPKSSRLQKDMGHPRLFNGFCFYLYKNSCFGSIGKKNLIALAKLAGGEIINREPQPSVVDPLEYPTRFHLKGENHKLVLTSHIILYDDKNRPPASKMHNMEHMKVLKTRWFVESLLDFELKDPESYL